MMSIALSTRLTVNDQFDQQCRTAAAPQRQEQAVISRPMETGFHYGAILYYYMDGFIHHSTLVNGLALHPASLREGSMLVLNRRIGESLIIGGNIEIKLLSVRGESARLGIAAPPKVIVHRQEVYEKNQRALGAAFEDEQASNNEQGKAR